MPNHIVEFVQFTIWQYIWPAIAVVVTFAIAVLLHEFGHFVVARLSGVQVEAFSIGFGKRLWGVVRHGTDYRISAIPLGGYVKLRGILSEEAERFIQGEEEKTEGEAGERGAESGERAEDGQTAPPIEAAQPAPAGTGLHLAREAMEDAAALRDKPWIVRVIVFCAGVGFNFLVAVAAFTFIAWIGAKVDVPLPSRVGPVKEWSSFYQAGLRYGDEIVRFDGRPVSTWSRTLAKEPPGVLDLVATLLDAKESTRPIPGVIRRREDSRITTVTLVLPSARDFVREYGAAVAPLIEPACIGGVVPFSAADKAGIKDGDVVLAIDNHSVKSFDEMREIVLVSLGKPLTFRLQRDHEEFTTVVTPRGDVTTPTVGVIGVIPGAAKRELLKLGFLEACGYGYRKSADLTVAVAQGTFAVFKRFRYREMEKSMAGPLGIFGITFKRAREGWDSFLFNLAFLNIALLIVNILPIPGLDGGHILITTIEAVTQRPVPARLLAGMLYVSIGLLLFVFIMVTWFDVQRFADWFNLGRLLK